MYTANKLPYSYVYEIYNHNQTIAIKVWPNKTLKQSSLARVC